VKIFGRWTLMVLPFVLAAPSLMASEQNSANEAIQKGKICVAKGDFDSAIAAFTEAIRLNPKCLEAYGNRGAARLQRGDFDKAIADFTEVIHLNPKDARAYHARGLAYKKKGERSKAETDFAEARKLGYKDTGSGDRTPSK
jgi:Flp pilus assembly protein TadD